MKRERIIRYCDLGIELSLAVLIFILPFRHTATIKSFLIIFPMLLWILKMVLERRILFVRTPLDFPILAFFLWGLVSLLTATDLRYSLNEIRKEMLTYFLVFYLVVNNIGEEEKIKGLIKALALGVFTMSFYGIMEFLHRRDITLTDVIKINSLTVDLGVYIVLTVPVIFAIYKFSEKIKEKFFLSIIILLSLGALYISHNRAAWIAFLTQAVLFTAIKKRWKTLLGMVIIIMILAAFSPFKNVLTHEVTVISPSGDIAKRETFQSRLVIWKEGVEKIKEHPITGIGYGRNSFKIAFPDNPVMKGDKGLWHTHNIFMETALEIGIPGLIIFLWLLYSLVKSLIEGIKGNTDFGRTLSTFLIIALVGFMIRNQFDVIYVDDTAKMFWLLMGMGFTLVLKKRNIPKYKHESWQ